MNPLPSDPDFDRAIKAHFDVQPHDVKGNTKVPWYNSLAFLSALVFPSVQCLPTLGRLKVTWIGLTKDGSIGVVLCRPSSLKLHPSDPLSKASGVSNKAAKIIMGLRKGLRWEKCEVTEIGERIQDEHQLAELWKQLEPKLQTSLDGRCV